MTIERGLPVSEMARHRAQRQVDEISKEQDAVERIKRLVMAANSSAEAHEGFDGSPLELFTVQRIGFEHGIRVAVRTLLGVGGEDFALPERGLKLKAIAVDLNSAFSLEQKLLAEGRDIASLYFDADGGTEPFPNP